MNVQNEDTTLKVDKTEKSEPSFLTKFKDFMFGFLVFAAIDAAITWVIFIILTQNDTYGIGKMFSKLFASLICFMINSFAIIYFNKRFKNTRPYFMMGIIILLIYPFLLFGSCFIPNF